MNILQLRKGFSDMKYKNFICIAVNSNLFTILLKKLQYSFILDVITIIIVSLMFSFIGKKNIKEKIFDFIKTFIISYLCVVIIMAVCFVHVMSRFD